MRIRALLPVALLALGAGLASRAAADPPAPPVDEFLSALGRYCGQAFAGRIVADEPAPGCASSTTIATRTARPTC